MKSFIPLMIISFALILSIIETLYGNPARLIVYVGILAFMWFADRLQKENEKEN